MGFPPLQSRYLTPRSIAISGSHLSGREPNDQVNPSFQGRAPVSMLGKAGDAYIMNNQTWCVGPALCVPCGILEMALRFVRST